MSEDVLKLLRDVTALYETTQTSPGMVSTIVRATLESALHEHVVRLVDALGKEFPNHFVPKSEYEKLVDDEVLKYKDKLLAAFHSRVPMSASYAAVTADLQFLTVNGVGRITDALLREGRIAEIGYKNGAMTYVCADTDRDAAPVEVVEVKDDNVYELTSTVSNRYLDLVESILVGNRYQTEYEIYEKARDIIASAPADPRFKYTHLNTSTLSLALMELSKKGRAVRKRMHTSGSGVGQATWKTPTRHYKKMRSGEWKKRIVDFLDSSGGMRFSNSALIMQLQEKYPEADHGRISSALDRLAKDGKLRRFHRRKIGEKRYEYWTTPPSPGPLPMPPSSSKKKK